MKEYDLHSYLAGRLYEQSSTFQDLLELTRFDPELHDEIKRLKKLLRVPDLEEIAERLGLDNDTPTE